MRKVGIVFAVLVSLFFMSPSSSFAARFMTCDPCGLCNNDPATCNVTAASVPGNWVTCAKCLYATTLGSNITATTALSCKTLIMGADNVPTFPAKLGRQYTMLGCISSGTTVGFTTQSAAPTFVQKILDVVFGLTGGVAFLYLMYGGFTILSSQADPEKLNYGRRLIYGSIIGLIFTFGSVFLVNLIGTGILRIPGFGTP